ncbi:MAG TPA: polyprenyl synthetase family protein [Kofleriaceae bacterium]|nr:polyprenyl synthetase family protein [Kofleriaceae bacterium]
MLAESIVHSVPVSPEARVASARAYVERWLEGALPSRDEAPRVLHHAMWDAVVPGGKRVRSLLVVLVADACGGRRPDLVGRLAAAVELVHCASLVHDDLPAFDDADTRRGRPTCHVDYGEPRAILAGDALLALAFEVLGRATEDHRAALRLVQLLAEHTGSARGIIGGQAIELEPTIASLEEYQSRKTATLFRVAAGGAAIACGRDDEQLRFARLGGLLGDVLQLRDDLDDCFASADELGKPVGQDAAHHRPNAVAAASGEVVVRRLRAKVADALRLLDDDAASIPLRLLVEHAAGPYLTAEPAAVDQRMR